jgi:hypothetical protein
MGDFRIVIEAVGGHGQDRDKKTGDVVDFLQGGDRTPEALALKFIEAMKEAGMTPNQAYIVHWPLDNYGGQLKNNRSSQIVDDFLTGKRNGSF